MQPEWALALQGHDATAVSMHACISGPRSPEDGGLQWQVALYSHDVKHKGDVGMPGQKGVTDVSSPPEGAFISARHPEGFVRRRLFERTTALSGLFSATRHSAILAFVLAAGAGSIAALPVASWAALDPTSQSAESSQAAVFLELEANTDPLDSDKSPPEGQSNCIPHRHCPQWYQCIVRCV